MLQLMGVEASFDARIDCAANAINAIIEQYESGDRSFGSTQDYQKSLRTIAKHANCSFVKVYQVEVVGVHPDNREKTMLVSVDAHGLLRAIRHSGWNSELVDVLACEIPPTAEGDKWRAANAKLADKSNGLLAPYVCEQLEIVTARGSHTTACVRLYKIGAKGIHSELTGEDGMISRSKIVESQPSMAEPADNGIEYNVIKWQLVAKCPRFMEVVSRTGNAHHGTARLQTTLQTCLRIWKLAAGVAEPDWSAISKSAAVDQGPEFLCKAEQICSFVQKWAGGEDGHILFELVDFESTLNVKREISPVDLHSLSMCELGHAPLYLIAMIKAMLTAPANFMRNGFADLFTNADYTGDATILDMENRILISL